MKARPNEAGINETLLSGISESRDFSRGVVQSYGAYNDAMLGISTNNRRRIKKIKLTEEQIRELKPRKVSQNCSEEIFETISVLSIQED